MIQKMPTVRHIIVCEGESEWVYLQRLQAFLDEQEVPSGTFEAPLRFINSERALAKTGSFGKIKSAYIKTRKANRRTPSIQIWVDFDLYHRNDNRCAEHYAGKAKGIPDFLFSFHNFEDFLALHYKGQPLEYWLRCGSPTGRNHFYKPLHSRDYVLEIEKIIPGYRKGQLPADFISWESLNNLKTNLTHEPKSNPHKLKDVHSFAGFLIKQIERAYPEALK